PHYSPGPSRPTLSLQVGHPQGVDRLAYSPDGKTIVTTGNDLTVRLWDAASGQLRATLPGMAFAFGPGGGLVTASFDGQVRFWDAGSGQSRGSQALPRAGPVELPRAFSPDARMLATIGEG